jgi:arylsulfatase A-like enzyme
LYEGGLRVPAFVVWKNQLISNARLDFPAVTSDYLPTILDILDMELPDDRPIDGESILGILTGTQKEREDGIGFIYGKKISWVTTGHKLISTDGGQSFELYDLIVDREERADISKEEQTIAAAMRSELDAWMESVQASAEGKDYAPD